MNRTLGDIMADNDRLVDNMNKTLAAILKQIHEYKQVMKGEKVTDIPVEAFMPERKGDEIL